MPSVKDLHDKIRIEWADLISASNGSPPANIAIWEDVGSIVSVLTPFLGPAKAHGHLPTGGGMDFHDIIGTGDGCAEMHAGGRSAYTFCPQRLIVCHIPQSPGESFVLLELSDMAAVGNRGNVHPSDLERGREELVELTPGHFVDRSCWDEQEIQDQDGDYVPLPDTARLVIRFLRGKFLFVAKGSFWNKLSSTYDGRHAHMTVEQIRTIIEGAVSVRGW